MIKSILDNDQYKFSMAWAVLCLYPEAEVEYRFTNRGHQRFNREFLVRLREEIQKMKNLALTASEYKWLQETIPFFPSQYLAHLQNYRYDPKEVKAKLTKDNNLELIISGKWHSTILWEVPLLALISQVYYETVDTDWKPEKTKQADKAKEKGLRLAKASCRFADFGTRRRRSYENQKLVVKALSKAQTFIGTSNMHLAHIFNLKPIGTMAHEWIMGVSALEGLRHANRFALQKWMQVYQARLGIALTDTFGTDAFLEDFDSLLAHTYDGVRQDSGNPIGFAISMMRHYQKLGIDPATKTVIFSDSLNVDKAIDIKNHFRDSIKSSFGIGTHFSNHFDNSPALNIVIKLRSVNGIEVVKLSDDFGKATGDKDALRVAKWTFNGEPLDVTEA